jgi:hypothetical protein
MLFVGVSCPWSTDRFVLQLGHLLLEMYYYLLCQKNQLTWMNQLKLSFVATYLPLCLIKFSILVPLLSFWMFTGNASRAKFLIDFLVHFVQIKVITPICSFADKFTDFCSNQRVIYI